MSFNEEHGIETYRSLIGISTEAFKALQLLNGGAVVALLAYLGQMAPSNPCLLARAQLPLGLFIAGLVTSTCAFVTAYLTQFALYNENKQGQSYKGIKHMFWLWISLFICLVSMMFFALGAFACLGALGP